MATLTTPESTTPEARKKSASPVRVLGMFAILALFLGAAVIFGLLPRLTRQRQFLAEAKADGDRPPVVNVVTVRRSAPKSELELPGTLVAMNEASIYARTDGYMKARYIDIGMRVKQGQLLAELDTPELDQQIRQAESTISQGRATLKQLDAAIRQTKANENIARITAERTRKLTAEGVFSRQDLDNQEAVLEARSADVAAAEANLAAGKESVAAAEANLARLKETKTFARITAPFDGYISYRSPDVGSLITAGNANQKSEMFRVAQIDPMRIFVSVPQSFVPQIQATAGTRAELTVDQLPGRKFNADVRRSNAALDAASRTMLTVLYIDNQKGELLPGMFANITFHVGDKVRPLVVPGDAIVGRSDGRYVAVADAQNIVHFHKIQPGRDFGTSLEVYDGVTEGEQVIANPTDDIHEGVKVEVRKK